MTNMSRTAELTDDGTLPPPLRGCDAAFYEQSWLAHSAITPFWAIPLQLKPRDERP